MSETVRPGGGWRESAAGRAAARHGPLILALFTLVAFFQAVTGRALTSENALNILNQVTVNAILAFGMTFPIVIGGIDLSVGSVHGMAGRIGVALLAASVPEIWAIPAAVAAGAAFGLTSGLVVSWTRVAPFIVTLGMMSIARGIAYIIARGSDLGVPPGAAILEAIGRARPLGIPVPVLLMAVLFAALWLVLHRTRFGHYAYAIGGNREAARLVGVPIRAVETVAYAITGACAGITGIVDAAIIYGAAPGSGTGYELDAIAAVVIGGASFSGGVGTMGGALIGTLLIGVLSNGLNLMGVHSFYQYVIKGIVILGAVLLDTLRKR
ncbi:MAG: ABC transporter permease [Planctomycetes bacterium]|nr:ABC transporter permease [Planctomycetota bacterium]